ncbi:GNAT family N-acetyltransferase [Streptomyces sp. NPDC088768]|uniref:GNAT family N-acetyltransferase n=1 Tax=Streptomyces sp. NPDC088768 TaxID=3365894 RepID=UPI00380965FD
MDITVHRPGTLTEADRAVWSALQAKAPQNGAPELANPFLSPEFALAFAHHRRGVRIGVVRENGDPVAFLPFQHGAGGVGRAIGLGLSDCQGLVHGPDFLVEPRALLRGLGLNVYEFDHLAGESQPFAAHASGRFASPVLDVGEGWGPTLEALRRRSPRFTRTTLAKERKLEREHGELRYAHDERDPAALATLMRWKSAQYRRTGRGDRFAHAWVSGLAGRLLQTTAPGGAGLLSVLYAGERPVAAHFGLRSAHVLACWFPAYDPAYAKYSPGLVLHLRMARAAAAEGIAYLDLGRGPQEYKESLRTRELTVLEGWATRRHPVAYAYRARRTPARAARNTVRTHSALFTPADRLLKGAGRLRSGGR